jgi:starch synthase
MKHIALGLVHHANQYIITNGYQNREGIDDLVGVFGGSNNYLHILELHRTYQIPLNLHLSGTLLEALRWYHPGCLAVLQDLAQQGLLELVGSSYGQNIMRFFTHEHNLKQLNEELGLYREHLQVSPDKIKVFWPPERVWDTKQLASVLTDPQLLNGGYRYVLIDDRLLYPLEDGSLSRQIFDQSQERRFADFALYRILHGQGLIVLPIANGLRQNIPPFDAKGFQKIEKLLRWLATAEPEGQGDLIAIYGDDLEKTAGIGGWDKRGPSQYKVFLRWLNQNPWVRTVKLSEWIATHRVTGVKCIDVGSFMEMSNHFGAGEGCENWYFDPQWDAYRSYYAWSEDKVKALSAQGANAALIELAWKQLLASSWETAWHTPSSGVHGNPDDHGAPSPWIKALASHSRHAAVVAAAAAWMQHKDNAAHAYMYDIDNDGEEELIVSNDTLFAVFTPQWGGRLIYLFSIEAEQGKMVIGNPCDDWNWMETLNKYMEIPANHPGALTDIGYEHDRYEPWIEVADGREVRVTLVNRQPGSPAVAMAKRLRLAYRAHEIRVTYQLPEALPTLTIECGMSPDYLHLLRSGRRSLTALRQPKAWGYANNGVKVWLRLKDVGPTVFDAASQREFGHGQAFRLIVSGRQFTFWIGTRQLESCEADDPGIEETRSCTWQ